MALSHLLLSVRGVLVNLPTSNTLSFNWNYGSMLGLVFVFQLFSGLFLSFYFCADGSLAFNSIQHIMFETNGGWAFRLLHSNGASLFFLFLFLHIFKALFFSSFRLKFVWLSGLSLFLFIIIEAFMGYVLVWAQMSFWACVVITSLLSVAPFFGPQLVLWLWGGFGVSSSTLKFFFVLHFLLPWALLLVVLFHLLFLHDSGSTSKLYCHGDYDKVLFYSFFWWNDFYNFVFWSIFFFFGFSLPYLLGDPEIYIESDPIISPVHIVPEWYFLFAYAILRAIPNNVLGVFALLISVLSFYLFSFLYTFSTVLDKLLKLFVFSLLFVSVVLSWLGQCLVEDPFLLFSGIFSFLYFSLIYSLLLFHWFSSFLFLYCIYY